MNGLFCLNKEPGPTSFGVIREFSRILAEKLGVRPRDLPSIGHCGTLDPFASGLLLVCVGPAVKLASYLLGSEKTYLAEMRFGVKTESGDFDTPVTAETGVRPASLSAIQKAADSFCGGDYLQIPPMYSAKKVGGKALYEFARKGVSIERKPVACRIRDFRISDFDGEGCKFSVTVSSGTYIRVLAQDLARKLATLGTLKSLHRTEASGFSVAQAMSLAELERFWRENPSQTPPCFVGFDAILHQVPRVAITEVQAQALVHGKQEILRELRLDAHADAPVTALYWGEKLMGLARSSELLRVFSFQWK